MSDEKKTDKRFRVTPEKVYGSFNKKNGKTVADLSNSLGVTEATVRKYVRSLAKQGRIKIDGTRETGQRGRPASLYVTA